MAGAACFPIYLRLPTDAVSVNCIGRFRCNWSFQEIAFVMWSPEWIEADVQRLRYGCVVACHFAPTGFQLLRQTYTNA